MFVDEDKPRQMVHSVREPKSTIVEKQAQPISRKAAPVYEQEEDERPPVNYHSNVFSGIPEGVSLVNSRYDHAKTF